MSNCTPTKRNAEEEPNGTISPKKSKTDSQEEVHFAQLFHEALEFIQEKMKVRQEELRKGLVTLIESFKYEKGNQFLQVDFNNSANLCAYFYRYSQLSTELSRSTILEAIEKCAELHSRFDSDEINVVSVGGGPGCDIVGLFSVLYKKVKCHKLNVTVVDSNVRWKSFLNIVEFLLREGDFGNASNTIKETNASISFMCEDVCTTRNQSAAYIESLGKADVVIMKSLLSILPFGGKALAVQDFILIRVIKKLVREPLSRLFSSKVINDRESNNSFQTNIEYILLEKPDTIVPFNIPANSNVVKKMKNGALLLFIDSPYCYYLDNCGLQKIYTSWIEKSPPNSPGKKSFTVQGSPIKNYGAGISCSSKAQIAVFMKQKVCDAVPNIPLLKC